MTAIAAPPTLESDALLRFAMRTDATLCAGAGLLIAFTADPLSRLSGLSPTTEWIAGAALVSYGVGLYAAARARAIRRVGTGVVVLNLIFVIAAIGLLVVGVPTLTGTGTVMLLGAVAATLGFAHLQYLGVRRSA